MRSNWLSLCRENPLSHKALGMAKTEGQQPHTCKAPDPPKSTRAAFNTGRRRLPQHTWASVREVSLECSPFTLNASLRVICTFVDGSQSSNKGDELVSGPTVFLQSLPSRIPSN